MPAAQIAAYDRFFQPEISKCIWMPAVANKAAPTRAEINAGLDLSRQIADVSGWTVTSGSIETPDMGSRYTGNIPGRRTSEDSNITFYGARDGNDVRTTLVRDANAFIAWMDGGDVAGYKMDVFPVRVSSLPKQRSVGDEAFRIQIDFSITTEPSEDIVIPA